MPNVLISIAYDGTPYRGWAWQPAVPTVEGHFRKALARFLNRDESALDFQGASRTDSGVHALAQHATFSFEEPRTLNEIVRGLNGLTPRTIRINDAREVPEGFNARHDSRGKHYHFRIDNGRFAHPLHIDRTWHVRKPLDAAQMQAGARHLIGEFDFTSFRASSCQASTTVRRISRIDVERHEHEVHVHIEGTAFLKYMVRNIVGTLVEMGRGKWQPERMVEIRDACDRQAAGPTAESQGLTLVEVFYDL